MRRLTPWTGQQIIDYNLRDGGTAVTIFADAQKGRVDLAKGVIEGIALLSPGKRMKIIEPGCSAGDISGPFSEDHDVFGCDVVPAAVAQTRLRYPKMDVVQAVAEDLEAEGCDILVLCEFLEHLHDPITFVREWMPLARYVIISHPLVGDGTDPEVGHVWAYDEFDFRHWFTMTGHTVREAWQFEMGAYHMAMGWGERK